MNTTRSTLNRPGTENSEEMALEKVDLEAVLDITEPANRADLQGRGGQLDQGSKTTDQSTDISVGQTVPQQERWRIVRRAVDLIRCYPGYSNSPSQHALEGTHHRY